MVRVSAGLVMYRFTSDIEVFLAHPGGPFFAKRDSGAWTIPKGEPESGEELRATAVREFSEEVGLPVREPLLELGEVRQKGGKVVHAWAFEGGLPDGFVLESNTCEIEWPRGSGKRRVIPEVDRAEFFPIAEARRRINQAQVAFLDRLEARLEARQP
ncbi:MAG TPA: NUDIX domain-containing protein [Polyangiaceae bacterium]|jgi:predicted NUDIX family NTP pyrophosphohydrolase